MTTRSPGRKIFNFTANFFDDATDLMTKNLRIDIERNRLTIFVGVVVRVTGEDVGVGAAQTDGRDAHDDFVRADATGSGTSRTSIRSTPQRTLARMVRRTHRREPASSMFQSKCSNASLPCCRNFCSISLVSSRPAACNS